MEDPARDRPEGSQLQAIHSPVGSLIRRQPVTVRLDASVREAIGTMARLRIGSVVVADASDRLPLGIFTLTDLLHRVALSGGDLEQPIAGVMTAGVVTVRPQTTAYQAALIMARRGLRHLLVVEPDGSLVGIVSQSDLFALQRTGVRDLSSDIRDARDLPALQACAADIRRTIDALLRQGTAAGQMTHLISTLNDLLTSRVVELTHDEFDLPAVKWCWIALGSEGRYEQTLSTDQDNGIVFDAASAAQAQSVRGNLLPFARAVNRKLDACGFPLCRGGIMAGNAECCLSLHEWRAKFSRWLQMPEPKALLNASIFFDFRPLYGDEELSDSLHGWLLEAVRDASLFLRLMAENALECRPPLGLLRDFRFDRNKEFPRTLDLKTYGTRPFVDAARVMALANGVAHTGTAQRLRSVGEIADMGGDDIAAIVDGFYYIQLLRLRRQRSMDAGAAGANRIDPRALNELDRHILKESFRQARKLQSRLALDFQL
ncbi:MAG: CBS domain-containing protein [Burkholderiales bacterium]|nr:MAG: CBS domain-containing protein [Burkholderiales bacterium]